MQSPLMSKLAQQNANAASPSQLSQLSAAAQPPSSHRKLFANIDNNHVTFNFDILF